MPNAGNTVPEIEDNSQLSPQDIEKAVHAIDLAAQKGAYEGWDVIVEVLTTRNRLVNFLHSIKQPQAPAQQKISAVEDDIPESPASN